VRLSPQTLHVSSDFL